MMRAQGDWLSSLNDPASAEPMFLPTQSVVAAGRPGITEPRRRDHRAELPAGRGCPMTDEELRAWAYLSRVVEPPCPELAALVADVGPVAAADRVKRGDVGDKLASRTEARRDVDCVAEDLTVLARLGGRVIVPGDDEWPQTSFTPFFNVDMRKRPEAHPPLVLWAVGPERLSDVAERSCALVGTRASTAYGEHVAAGLVERDVAVVSGGAYGIDGAAHRATLATDGITTAVLAGGIDVPYPSGHSALLHRIAKRGLVVTEYPPGVRPARQTAPHSSWSRRTRVLVRCC
jgi:DNA processing protein